MDKKGKVRALKDKQLKFDYRQSNLNRYIVLEAKLKLIKRSPKKIRENIAKFLKQKSKTQDLTSKSAGCIFKNPPLLLTGKLIEECGLKGKKIGDAQVSYKHANFIINLGSAKASDVLELITYIKGKVKVKFNIDLELEIILVKNND